MSDKDKKVVSLKVAKNEPVPEVVQLLEILLQQAKAGEFTGFAFAAGLNGRCTGSAFVIGETDIAVLHLALSRLQARLLEYDEDDFYED